ncbi:MAG TPA: O-antigen ligase family protein, partial [Saprospiraceae bacterium]|nr:O-antigen ligase family protein [Saprospiraceae bacterium]
MSKNIPSSFSFIPSELLLFGVFACIVLASVFGAVYTEMYFLAGFPAVLLLGYLAVVDFRKIYYLLLFSIPLSTEVVLPNGFGTDLPTEPLTVGLMLLFLLFWFRHRSAVKADFLKHPVTLLLLLHWGWMVVPMLS